MVNQKVTPPNFVEILEKNNLVSDKWKPVNDKVYQLVSANEEETLPYLDAALKVMCQINDAEEKNEVPFPDANAKKYFHTDFVPNLCKYLLLNRSYRLSECIKIHDAIIYEALRFYNNNILLEDAPKHVEMIRNIFDMQKMYYKLNNQDENQNMPVIINFFKIIFFFFWKMALVWRRLHY